MKERKNIYFASDLHLGMHPRGKSLEREKAFVSWLEFIREDAERIYLLGDIFDYWFEYRKVVPRGFTRFLGKIAELSDAGIEVHIFTGNHDVWIFDYLPKETGMIVHRGPLLMEHSGKRFYLAHGDGLGAPDAGFKIMKWIFNNKILQWLYARLHPNFATSLAHMWSKKSRYVKGITTEFLGEDKEHLIQHSKQILDREHFDYFIYGHRHLPMEYEIAENSKIIYLGDWIVHYTYAVFDRKELHLKRYLWD